MPLFPNTRKLERELYLAQRTMGDVRAAHEGRLVQRVTKRVYHRSLIKGLRKIGLW